MGPTRRKNESPRTAGAFICLLRAVPPSPFSRTYCAAAHPSDPVEPFIGSETGIITAAQFSECLVIGEVESEQKYAIVYSLKDGNVGFIPTTNLGDGNG